MVENAFLCYSIYGEGNGFLGIIIEKIWNYEVMPACVPIDTSLLTAGKWLRILANSLR
jgi:hypothetical protein